MFKLSNTERSQLVCVHLTRKSLWFWTSEDRTTNPLRTSLQSEWWKAWWSWHQRLLVSTGGIPDARTSQSCVRAQKSTLVFFFWTGNTIVVKANGHLKSPILLWYSIIGSWNASADVHACVKLSKRRPPQAQGGGEGMGGGAGGGGTRIYRVFILDLFQVEPWPSQAEGRHHLSVGGANKILLVTSAWCGTSSFGSSRRSFAGTFVCVWVCVWPDSAQYSQLDNF